METGYYIHLDKKSEYYILLISVSFHFYHAAADSHESSPAEMVPLNPTENTNKGYFCLIMTLKILSKPHLHLFQFLLHFNDTVFKINRLYLNMVYGVIIIN